MEAPTKIQPNGLGDYLEEMSKVIMETGMNWKVILLGGAKELELPHQTRHHGHFRLEMFADVILGFAVTLAVVSLEVPRSSHELLLLARGFGSFLVTFAALFYLWKSINRFFKRYAVDDDTVTWICGGILFTAVFYTYPLKFLASNLLDPLFGLPGAAMDENDKWQVLALYGAGIGVLMLLFWALYRHVWNLRDSLALDDAERLDAELEMRKYLWGAGVGPVLMVLVVIPAVPEGSLWRLPTLLIHAGQVIRPHGGVQLFGE